MRTSDLELARQAARLGAEVAARYFRTDIPVSTKTGPGDVVTVADRHAEHAVVELLTRHRPDDGVLGEEGSLRSGERTWVVDALDGSLNFVRGDPFWCCAVALADPGGPLVAAVHHAESGETFAAQRGAGCWLGDAVATVRPSTGLATAVVSTYIEGDDIHHPVHRSFTAGSAGLRVRGSGSLEMAWIAAGRGDAWVARDMQPWDRLPGALLIGEAGGVSKTWDMQGVNWFVAGHRSVVEDLLRLSP